MARTRAKAESAVSVSRGMPDMRVRVLDDQAVSHPTARHPEGEAFGPGDEFDCEGPLAQHLVMSGHVEVVGMASTWKAPK